MVSFGVHLIEPLGRVRASNHFENNQAVNNKLNFLMQ